MKPYRAAILHPKRTLLVAFGLLVPAALGMLRLELRTDGGALAPERAPAIEVDDEIRAAFGIEDPIVVMIETDHARGVFNFETLSLVRELSAGLEELPEAGAVSSLANESSDRVGQGSLRFLPFLEPFPTTEAELERVREDVRALEIYHGTLVASDEQACSVVVGVPEGADLHALVRAVGRLVDGVDPGADRVRMLGAPVAEVWLGVHLLRDLGVPAFLLGGAEGRWGGLVPLAVVVVFLVFWIAFRNPFAAFPPLIEVGACTLAVLGIMGWCGVPFYLTIAVLPIILFALGIADEVHVFARYHQLAHEQPGVDGRTLVERAFDDKASAVVKTSVTTAIGFLSFTLSPIAAVRAFGVFTALGIVLCMLWTLTVIPAMLVQLGPERFLARRGRAARTLAWSRAVAQLALRAAARPRTVVAAAAVLALTCAFGLTRVRVQDGWISGFAASSAFRRATSAFEEGFLGTHRLLVCVDAGHVELRGELEHEDVGHRAVRLPGELVGDAQSLVGSRLRLEPTFELESDSAARSWTTVIESVQREGGRLVATTPRRGGSAELASMRWGEVPMLFLITPERMKQPAVLDVIGEFEDFLTAQVDCAVGGTLGPVRYLETTSFMQQLRNPSARAVPRDTFDVQILWHNYGTIRGRERLRQTVEANFSRALVEVYLKGANFVDTQRLLERVRRFERERLTPAGLSLSFSGDVATSQALIEAVVSTQIRSVLVSLLGIVLVVSIFTRSPLWGVLAVLPAGLSVLFNLALMGAVGIPLGVATSMFAAMTLGIGVDYAIHFLEWIRGAGGDEDAIGAAARVTGPAILVDGLAVALGMGVLALSQIPANARLGFLLLSSIAGCLVVTLVLLPAVVRLCVSRAPENP